MSEIRRHADSESLGKAAAQLFYNAAREAIDARGRFTVVLSGGSTPKLMHKEIVIQYADKIDWRHVHVFWGDERNVPPDHDDSNYRMAKETLLDHISIPSDNVHRIPAEKDAVQAANEYNATLRRFFTESSKIPVLDLIWLGLGDDGHTASLFPHTAALNIKDQLVVANFVPKFDVHRITFTVPFINAARKVVFMVAGEGKANALREVVNGPHIPETYPAQFVEPESGQLVWMVDKAAASLI